MHTAEPRVLGTHSYNLTGKVHWQVTYDGNHPRHWRLEKLVNEKTGEQFDVFTLDLKKLSADLRRGILGPYGFLDQLNQSVDLQRHFLEFEHEIECY